MCLSGCARARAARRGDTARALRGRLRPRALPRRAAAAVLAPRPRARPRRWRRSAEQLGVPCVATGNVHSHHPDRAPPPGRARRRAPALDPRADRATAARQRSSANAAPGRDGGPLPEHRTRSPRPADRRADRVRPHPRPRLPLSRLRTIPDADRNLAELCRAKLEQRYRGQPEQREAGDAPAMTSSA